MNHIIFISMTLFLHVHAIGAASSSEQATMTTCGPLTQADPTTCARTDPSLTKRPRFLEKNPVLRIDHQVLGGRGRSFWEVNLTERCYLSNQRFIDLIQEDKQLGLDWIAAKVYFKATGGLGEDTFDARYWHGMQNNSARTTHPAFKGKLKGDAYYFAVKKEESKLTVNYLGTEGDTQSNTVKASKLRALLNLNQNPALWMRISLYSMMLGQYQDAERWIKMALPSLQTELVNEEISLGRAESSLMLLEHALEIMQQHNMPHGFMLKKLPRACVLLHEEMQKNDPDKAKVLFAKMKHWSEQALVVLPRENKSLCRALFDLAQVYQQEKDYEKAIVTYKQMIETSKLENRTYGLALNNLVRIFFLKQDWQEILNIAEEAIQVLEEEGRNHCSVLCNLSLAYFNLGMYQESIDSFYTLMSSVDEFYSDIFTWIGRAHEALGRFDEAALAYSSACSWNDCLEAGYFVHILYVYATHPETCNAIDENDMRKYAESLSQSSLEEIAFYLKEYPERYAIALQKAQSILESFIPLPDDDSFPSSSEESNEE